MLVRVGVSAEARRVLNDGHILIDCSTDISWFLQLI